MLEGFVVLLMIAVWYTGYLNTMRYISITGGYRNACDWALEMKVNKKTFYLSMLITRLMIFISWPICFVVRAMVFAMNDK